MEKIISSSTKARRTRLSKKTTDELIDIILRKDDVEKKQDTMIKCLKTNISGLEKKLAVEVHNHKNDAEYAENIANDYFAKLKTAENNLDNKIMELNKCKFRNQSYLKQLQNALFVILGLLLIIAGLIVTIIIIK